MRIRISRGIATYLRYLSYNMSSIFYFLFTYCSDAKNAKYHDATFERAGGRANEAAQEHRINV